MIYEVDHYPQDFQQKIEAFEIIQKAFDSEMISTDSYLLALDVIEKAKKDISKLRKVKKFYVRNGKTYLGTFYVSDDDHSVEQIQGTKFVEAEVGTPEVMIGQYVKFTKNNKESVEGPVEYLYSWVNPKTNEFESFIYVTDPSGKRKEHKVSTISNFSIFNAPKADKEYSDGVMDANGYKIIKTLGGSTGAVLVEKNGIKYVKKTAANPDHLANEVRSLKYFDQMGVPVPKVIQYEKGECVYLEYIDGLTLQDLASQEPDLYDNVITTKIAKHFAAHCVMANHDVIGLNFDNVIINKSGNPVFVDVGGSMKYRAMGGLKDSWVDWDSNQPVQELKSMLDYNLSKTAASVFSNGLYRLVEDPLSLYSEGKEGTTEEKITSIIHNQLLELKENIVGKTSSGESQKLMDRINKALKETAPQEVEEKSPFDSIKEAVEDTNNEARYSHKLILRLYQKEIMDAVHHDRKDISDFYSDFAASMVITQEDEKVFQEYFSSEIKEYYGVLKAKDEHDKALSQYSKEEDPEKRKTLLLVLKEKEKGIKGSHNQNQISDLIEFFESDSRLRPEHLIALRQHTGSAGIMNTTFRTLVQTASEYNISFKDKEDKVKFNKEYFNQTSLKKDHTSRRNLATCKFAVEAFAILKGSGSPFYRRDVTLYRGIVTEDLDKDIMGKKTPNIWIDKGISSNGQNYDKAWSGDTKIITMGAEGIAVEKVGSHPSELETIMKPMNIQQTIIFADSWSGKKNGADGRWQVRCEKPGLIPIKFD